MTVHDRAQGRDGEEVRQDLSLRATAAASRNIGNLDATAASVQDSVSIVLQPRRAKLVCLLLGSLVFVGIGLVARTPGTLLGVAFFGLGVVVFGVMLLPGAAYLSLDADGFTTCSLFRRHRIPWSDVGPFGVTQVKGHVMVGYDLIKGATRSRLAAVNVALMGYGCALPDTYGLPVQELAALMNEARLRARSASL